MFFFCYINKQSKERELFVHRPRGRCLFSVTKLDARFYCTYRNYTDEKKFLDFGIEFLSIRSFFFLFPFFFFCTHEAVVDRRCLSVCLHAPRRFAIESFKLKIIIIMLCDFDKKISFFIDLNYYSTRLNDTEGA